MWFEKKSNELWGEKAKMYVKMLTACAYEKLSRNEISKAKIFDCWRKDKKKKTTLLIYSKSGYHIFLCL